MIALFPLFENKNFYRQNIKPGTKVYIVLKQDQKSGKLTYGIVDKILTSKAKHSRGIKVRIKGSPNQSERQLVGRVQKIIED